VVDAFITITRPAGDSFCLQSDGTWSLTIAPDVANWPLAPVNGTILDYTFQGAEPTGAMTPVGREARSSSSSYINSLVGCG